MSLETFRFNKHSYFYDSEKPHMYWYEKKDSEHILIYKCRNYIGHPFKVEWRIPGSSDLTITYAKRMALKMEPWDVIDVGVTSFNEDHFNAESIYYRGA